MDTIFWTHVTRASTQMPTSGPFGKVVGRSPADSSTASMMATPDLITSEDDCLSVGQSPASRLQPIGWCCDEEPLGVLCPGLQPPGCLITDIYPLHTEYQELSLEACQPCRVRQVAMNRREPGVLGKEFITCVLGHCAQKWQNLGQ